jgi:hypothetical protein
MVPTTQYMALQKYVDPLQSGMYEIELPKAMQSVGS